MIEVTRNNVVLFRKQRIGTLETNNSGGYVCRNMRGQSAEFRHIADAMLWFTATDWRSIVCPSTSTTTRTRRIVRQPQARRWAIN